MPTYVITAPDGNKYQVTAPEGASESEVLDYAKQNYVKAAPKQNPEYEAGKQSSLRGLASVMQGPTFGFADEIGGVLGAAVDYVRSGKPLTEGYRENRDFIRGASDQVEKETPIFSAITRGMASAPLALVSPGANLFKGTGAMANMGRAGVAGGTTGLITGLGDSTADTIGGMVADTALGGAKGAAFGVAGERAIAGLGAVGGKVAQSGVLPQSVTDKFAGNFAAQKVAEALARDNTDPARVTARMATLGDRAAPVDAAGYNTRQLVDALATMPGQTKNTVESLIRTRQATRADALRDAAEDSFNINGVRLAGQVKDWIAEREAAASPLYNRVTRMTVTPDNNLVSIINAADELGATTFAQKIATARQMPWTLDANGKTVSMRDLDNLKKGLDQLVSKETKPDGALTPLGASYSELRTKLLNKLDSATMGVYKEARDAFAGPSALIDAAAAGKRALLSDDASIRELQAGLSRSEKDAFSLGAFEALREKLGGRAGQTQMMELWREKGMQEKLKAIFGIERAYREFASSLAKERVLKQAESLGRGSQTAARQQGIADLDNNPLGDVASAAVSAKAGNPIGVIGSAMRGWNRVQTPEPVRDAMGRMLLTPGQNLSALTPTLRKIEEQRARQAAGFGMTFGSQLPGLLAP